MSTQNIVKFGRSALRAGSVATPAEYARQLLAATVTPAEQARCDALSDTAQLGTLTAEERGELEELIVANDLLTILHAKAELSLRASGPGTAAGRT